ncbi:MAG: hypothetical protein NZ729_03085 [Methylococcales bacterium]|nr:hypothetical protein [Methylococcales bacterium]
MRQTMDAAEEARSTCHQAFFTGDIPCGNRETKEYPKLGDYCLLTKFREGLHKVLHAW